MLPFITQRWLSDRADSKQQQAKVNPQPQSFQTMSTFLTVLAVCCFAHLNVQLTALFRQAIPCLSRRAR